ncbi:MULTISPECIES: SDR family oxidoreductase [unclassified Paenibacillus]|uniref:SDR family NAD(P)-dependent oxidoreductase n=1 Tax=unclassified Paenibacillus TaxID=185978 RepID=UPI001C10BA3D|nr:MULTISPECIES: SDR family oxidoreductase [unclassified Paenibacillus]MBU5440882.1 SDR family oxidoreductase [Paenibacillus sp. MSJ-34]CAH0118418.1 3-phenylpropionate-dihydrodiol/cinnamic acid-dihydrodiol dehydrogenase [Paenibacillus sp. CECT 9249]
MLHGKVALITGASSGIGALTAQMLAAKGAIPVLTARNAEKLRDAALGIRGEYVAMTMDVTDTGQICGTVERIMDKFGKIDILINNAGYGIFESFDRLRIEQFADMMDVNYMGVVRCTKAVLPHMLEAGSGHIVNVASMAGKIGTAKSTSYTATKHAVLGFTNSLRQELAGTNVTVSSVNPGPIDTPFFEKADPSGNYVRNVSFFILKPEKVAGEIVKLIERRKPELNLPRAAAAGIKLYQLFPRLADKLTYRWLNRK